MADDLRLRAREAAALLERLAAEPRLLADLPREERHRLLIAAGTVSRPEREAHRAMRRALRKKARDEVRRSDENILDATGIRAARRAPIFTAPPLLPRVNTARAEQDDPPPQLNEPRKCYVCKAPFTCVDRFYDQMCEPCAALNYRKRHQTCDLSGRTALVTGARVKIGYHAALKLLRAGCHVIVTTRFPRDAAARYAREGDFEEFRERLEVCGLDLRHTPSVESFCHHLLRARAGLDFIINNACQTVRRPPGFYKHLMDAELTAPPEHLRSLLVGHEELGRVPNGALVAKSAGLLASAELSQLPLLANDHAHDLHLFPEGKLDADLQQVDLRDRNSWRLTLAEVPIIELLEVHLVNAVAPFVLNARLKPLMVRVPTRDKHVVNVSAMEGQFYRAWKTDRHPHTNMAKASLNMMTRTSAADYVKDGIHMNSVDTGWITDEDPVELASRKVREHGFEPPLDVVDGAARIVDPIFDGFLTGEHRFGLFLKDYAPTPW